MNALNCAFELRPMYARSDLQVLIRPIWIRLSAKSIFMHFTNDSTLAKI